MTLLFEFCFYAGPVDISTTEGQLGSFTIQTASDSVCQPCSLVRELSDVRLGIGQKLYDLDSWCYKYSETLMVCNMLQVEESSVEQIPDVIGLLVSKRFAELMHEGIVQSYDNMSEMFKVNCLSSIFIKKISEMDFPWKWSIFFPNVLPK